MAKKKQNGNGNPAGNEPPKKRRPGGKGRAIFSEAVISGKQRISGFPIVTVDTRKPLIHTKRPAAPIVHVDPPPKPPDVPQFAVNEVLALLAELATCFWDVERKIRPEGTADVPMKHKIAHRRAQRALQRLKQAGLEIHDYIGQPYVDGMNLTIHLQPTEGATQETIVDAVRPTIYWKDKEHERAIQIGEVWVAIPPPKERPNSEPVPPAAEVTIAEGGQPTATSSESIKADKTAMLDRSAQEESPKSDKSAP